MARYSLFALKVSFNTNQLANLFRSPTTDNAMLTVGVTVSPCDWTIEANAKSHWRIWIKVRTTEREIVPDPGKRSKWLQFQQFTMSNWKGLESRMYTYVHNVWLRKLTRVEHPRPCAPISPLYGCFVMVVNTRSLGLLLWLTVWHD